MISVHDWTPRISVVTPVFNVERYLRASIESILEQTFTDFEFILVDDGSTDATVDILREAVICDRRITVVLQQHTGIARLLNIGVTLARGEFIARHDGDDISLPERLEEQVQFLDSHPEIAVVGSFVEVINEDDLAIGEITMPVESDRIREKMAREMCLWDGTLLIRRSALLAVGGYRPEFLVAEDFDVWLRLSEQFGIANLPRILYCWRDHGSNISKRLHHVGGTFVRYARELAEERRQFGRDSLHPRLGTHPTR